MHDAARVLPLCTALKPPHAAGCRIRLCCATATPAAGPGAPQNPPEALQHSHREGLSRLGAALRALPWPAPSGGSRRAGGRGLSNPSGSRRQRGRGHAEAGEERPPLPLQGSARDHSSVAGWRGVREAVEAGCRWYSRRRKWHAWTMARSPLRTRPLLALFRRSNCISRPGAFHDLAGVDCEPLALAAFVAQVASVIAIDRESTDSPTPRRPTPIRNPATLRAPRSSDPRSMPFARRIARTKIRRPPDLGGAAVPRRLVQTGRTVVGAGRRSQRRPGSTTIRAHPPPPGGACPLPSSQ